jgi:hypothetical protein
VVSGRRCHCRLTQRRRCMQLLSASRQRTIQSPRHAAYVNSAMQMATAVWHICEQARSVCGAELGDIVIAIRLGGRCAEQQPGLAVAVAAATPAIAMQALQQIVQLAVKLG